jgi:SAM-dependent methyltransferase
MTVRDSKALAEKVSTTVPRFEIKLGPSTAASYVGDPRHLAFVSSRYKFVGKMLEGFERVLEVGCGDAFGAPFVAQAVGELICTDIDEPLLEDNRLRCAPFANIAFEYFDFREKPLCPMVDGLYLIDVLEHIFPKEEEQFCINVFGSLKPHGVAVVGVPNITGEAYASPMSKLGHVNLKDDRQFRETLKRYFHNVFLFSMNDEVIHTGYRPMSHYLFAICCEPRHHDRT